MATLNMSDIADRAIASLKELNKGEWWQTISSLQSYPMMEIANSSLAKEKNGNKLSFRLAVPSTTADGHHGLYEDYDLDRPDLLTEGTLDWTNLRAGFAFDLRELDPAGAPEHVVDDMAVQHSNMYVELTEDFENAAWNVPALNDKLMPFGIPFWIVWSSAGAGTFTSDAPAGHTTLAGINPSTQSTYRNWTDTYSQATRDDLGLRISRAIRKTNFRPPPKVKDVPSQTHRIYTNLTQIENLEKMAANQNDQLGMDAQPAFNSAMVARISPTWVPQIDENAASGSNPVYIVNHASLMPKFKSGWRFHHEAPRKAPKQPTVVETSVWATYNWCCANRRQQAVVAASAPFGETG